MTDQVSNPNPGAPAAANPATEPATADGTVQNSGDAARQSASAVEGFTHVDPNTLPPQLRSAYDNMLRDYKEKTTKVADTVKSQVAKEVEAFRQKAEFYDQISQQKDFVEKWNSYVEEVGRKAQVEETKANLPPEVQQRLEKVDQIEQKLQQAQALEVINAFADAVDEKGQKIHPDFERLSSFKIGTHQQAGEYDLLRAAVELAPGNNAQEKLENGYKAASEMIKKIEEEVEKRVREKISGKVRNSSFPPSNAGNLKSAPGRPKDALEALQWAKQGLSVQR